MPQNNALSSLATIILASCLIILPFFDPFILNSFLSSIILEKSLPNLYTIIAGIIILNCGVYGINILASCISLKSAEKDSKKPLHTEQYAKRRHPIFASLCLIGVGYEALMGSTLGVIMVSVLPFLLYLEAKRQEKEELIPKYGQVYKGYSLNVPVRIFSLDVVILLMMEYLLFGLGFFFT
ncbi:MAG: hypothetical protein EU548_07995 [Promethearchaeota archaeon]|nr:MAG: hypothetical protein EU548_07995 [Candidatus Lokiarchaeota archaeon]